MQLLAEWKDIPEDFKYKLFPTIQKEYELSYAWKMRKEDLFANDDGIFPVPLQIEKTFNGNEHEAFDDGWKNMIVFWDNLQFLKTLNENKDPIIKDKVKWKVKLIYIDPPFATTDEFQNKEWAKAYNDKKKGAEFIEFLRRRLLLAKELLSDDGFIYVHLDQKTGHYMKIILDEIFWKQYFRNEIIWHYTGNSVPVKSFPKKHDVIFLYSKSETPKFNFKDILEPYSELTVKRYNHTDENGKKYKISALSWWKQEIVYAKDWKYPDDVWDIPVPRSKDEITGYPTQKPETLLKRILLASSNKGDLIFDFFWWSWTTMSVAERLWRKWISCDLWKLAYFTEQKRILTIQDAKNLEKDWIYWKKAKSFMTCSLGMYDLKTALELEWSKYQEFVWTLFEISIKTNIVWGFEFDGKKWSSPVKIWDYNKHKNANVDEAYIESIHQSIRGKVTRIYIVAPANNIGFISDYYELEGIKYYFLKIPYQVIKELHKKSFHKIRQPQSKKNVNDLDEAIGFHFIKKPEVKSEVLSSENEINIVIKEFRSQYYKDEEWQKLENFETLSAVFIDRNFNWTQFIMTDVIFADELLSRKWGKKKKIEEEEEEENEEDEISNDKIREELKEISSEGLRINLLKENVWTKIMIIYTDIYGNDFSEILTVK